MKSEFLGHGSPNFTLTYASSPEFSKFYKSSWRALTNHPHYEDKLLRETTFDVYQMYAMRTPEEVLERLGKYGTTHILVENSICYQGGRKEDNCATPDLLDLANDHLESDRTTKKVT